MRILVITKRQYTGKDLLDDRYGRLYEIPEALAARGHEVAGLALSYRRRPTGRYRHGRVAWQSENIGLPILMGLPAYLKKLNDKIRAWNPDVVWASSDALHAGIAWHACKKLQVPFVVDLYDNYESFGLSQLPGMKFLLQKACRAAQGLTVVSHTLDEYISHQYRVAKVPRLILGNAVNKRIFYPRSRQEVRELLGLPDKARLVGTAGALTANRGVDTLFRAFIPLAEQNKNLWLVVAGPRDRSVASYRHERIIDLGILDHDRVALLFCALDVAVICNLDSDFGRYCFPQKFFEIVATRTPLVAADVGEMQSLLAERPDCRFQAKSVASLSKRIGDQLAAPAPIEHLSVPDWSDRSLELEDFFTNAVSAGKKPLPDLSRDRPET